MRTEPHKQRHYDTKDERAFLAQQAADAKTALQYTIAEMQTAAKEVANVPWWTQHYPWYAVGAAAVLGCVATAYALAPPDHHTRPAPPVASQVAARPSWKASLFELVRSTLMSVVMGALHPSDQQSEQTQATQTDASLA